MGHKAWLIVILDNNVTYLRIPPMYVDQSSVDLLVDGLYRHLTAALLGYKMGAQFALFKSAVTGVAYVCVNVCHTHNNATPVTG